MANRLVTLEFWESSEERAHASFERLARNQSST